MQSPSFFIAALGMAHWHPTQVRPMPAPYQLPTSSNARPYFAQCSSNPRNWMSCAQGVFNCCNNHRENYLHFRRDVRRDELPYILLDAMNRVSTRLTMVANIMKPTITIRL